MSGRIGNGGPAFPMIRDMRNSPDWDHEPGMTLRDYFAAKAMKAIVSKRLPSPNDVGMVAFMSYQMADAMLGERAK